MTADLSRMTTGEAEAYRQGWRDAVAMALAAREAIATPPMDPGLDLASNGHRKGAAWAANTYRDMIATIAPPPMPARTRFGILGEG